MKKIIILNLIILCITFSYANTINYFLLKGDSLYYSGDLYGAMEEYYNAYLIENTNTGALTGLYNTNINTGGIESANKYAYELYNQKKNQLNEDRVIYSDALLGKTGKAEDILKDTKDYYRSKAIYSLAGYGLKQTGYYITTSSWYKKALNAGFKTDEFKDSYLEASKLIKDDLSYIDVIYSYYKYGNNQLLKGGYNFNLNYNFGTQKHKFNLNLVTQGTSINKNMNFWVKEIGPNIYTTYNSHFYDDIGQYELFGQYNYILSPSTSIYTGMKTSWLLNDYVQNQFSASVGCRFNLSDNFRANTYFNASNLSYNYYDIIDTVRFNIKPFKTFTNSMSSLQYTFDGAFTFQKFYLGGVINLVRDINSKYAKDMLFSDRDISDFSININDKDIRFLYGVTAGYNDENYDIFSSYTTGDLFLVNTSEGRYLNTNDSELKMNILGGVIFKKLFGDWVLGYTLSFSEFENYTILTNSIIANYNWRQKK